jgi:hypothetical protein
VSHGAATTSGSSTSVRRTGTERGYEDGVAAAVDVFSDFAEVLSDDELFDSVDPEPALGVDSDVAPFVEADSPVFETEPERESVR